MIPTHTLDQLLDVARNAHEGEARMLAENLKNARAAEDRLVLLVNFRHDYEGRFRERAAVGFAPGEWRNFNVFLAQLNQAIDAQRAELATRRQAAEQRRAKYNMTGVRLRSY